MYVKRSSIYELQRFDLSDSNTGFSLFQTIFPSHPVTCKAKHFNEYLGEKKTNALP